MRSRSLLQLKDYEGAVEWGKRGIRDNENIFRGYAQVLFAPGHLGRSDKAEQVLANIMRVKPGFSIASIDDSIRIRNSVGREHYIEGLYKADSKEKLNLDV